jgi:hypothetical protein
MAKHFFKALIIFVIMIALGLVGIFFADQAKQNEAQAADIAK